MKYLKKKSYTVLFLLVFIVMDYGCTDYLDVIPDNLATISTAFSNRINAEKYLFGCYSYIPITGALLSYYPMVCSDETWTYPVYPSYMGVVRGFQNVRSPYWDFWGQNEKNMFQAIRDCNLFLENIREVKELTEEERESWIAEVTFLKAFYHYWLLRMYGPIPIIEKSFPVSANVETVRVEREPVDKVVDYIVSLLDTAAANTFLVDIIEDRAESLGRITRPIVLALKAKVLVTAASPLFNGNKDQSSIRSKVDKRPLFNLNYDPAKWDRAALALKEAIDAAHKAGNELYVYQGKMPISDTTFQKLTLRNMICDPWNVELIWGISRISGGDGYVQNAGIARLNPQVSDNWSSKSTYTPSLRMAELFYSSNGVPINEDKQFDFNKSYTLRTATSEYAYYIKKGEQTARLHFDREPRFYAFLGFDRAIWYGQGNLNDKNSYWVEGRLGEYSGKATGTNYSITGYWPKKLVGTEFVLRKHSSSGYSYKAYPFPMIRLADLYLLYAEALNEQGKTTESHQWIDKVRLRAGLKGVVESWKNYSIYPEKPNTQEGMRDIIHQERMIELAFEGQRYLDLRRWKKAMKFMNTPIRGWDVSQYEAKNYYRVVTLHNLSFETKDYFWPIKEYDLLTNPKLVQNYGW